MQHQTEFLTEGIEFETLHINPSNTIEAVKRGQLLMLLGQETFIVITAPDTYQTAATWLGGPDMLSEVIQNAYEMLAAHHGSKDEMQNTLMPFGVTAIPYGDIPRDVLFRLFPELAGMERDD
ncbi:hypothetical protein M1555_01820 [Patescibacteria group bacterium]|nr:hypothetical protein [Patescibacteria group bacterium]